MDSNIASIIITIFAVISFWWIIITSANRIKEDRWSKTSNAKDAEYKINTLEESNNKLENKVKSLSKEKEDLEQSFKIKKSILEKDYNKFRLKLVEEQYKEERKLDTQKEELKAEIKQLKTEIKSLKRHIQFLSQQFPLIEDEADLEDIEIEYVAEYLTKEEYDELSDTERNKLALERYQKKKKSKWEIGRDFEMFAGYKLSQAGYKIEYPGIEKKLNDLGRDLIAYKDGVKYIVQCKYWSKNKLIREKHLCQLYGTTVMYNLQNKENAVPMFVSHCKLSDTAKEFAAALNILVYEDIELKDFPAIKCNLKAGIYHLPFDQQYDSLSDRNCYYAWTIEEAESKGCRRAYKWHGTEN